MRKITIIIASIVLAYSLIFLVYTYASNNRQNQVDQSTQNQIVTSPTPIPYAEMTIPYLRSLTYESALGERVIYQDYPNYTSYLTSYRSDNLKINGLLTIPKGTVPDGGWPAIVFVHGYIPPTQYVTTEKYVAYVDALARSGFVVFKIDLRGHGQSEGDATGAYYSEGYVIDTLHARSALASADFVNKNKIGLWGHSMAGNVTLRALATMQDIPAVVIWAGAVFTYEDMQKYGLSDNSYRPPLQVSQRVSRRNEMFRVHGQFTKDSYFWKQVVPVNYLEKSGGAVQLHHPVDDDVVNVEYSRGLSKLLDLKGVDHEYHEYQSGGHNIESPYFEIAMTRTIDFYNKHLKNK